MSLFKENNFYNDILTRHTTFISGISQEAQMVWLESVHPEMANPQINRFETHIEDILYINNNIHNTNINNLTFSFSFLNSLMLKLATIQALSESRSTNMLSKNYKVNQLITNSDSQQTKINNDNSFNKVINIDNISKIENITSQDVITLSNNTINSINNITKLNLNENASNVITYDSGDILPIEIVHHENESSTDNIENLVVRNTLPDTHIEDRISLTHKSTENQQLNTEINTVIDKANAEHTNSLVEKVNKTVNETLTTTQQLNKDMQAVKRTNISDEIVRPERHYSNSRSITRPQGEAVVVYDSSSKWVDGERQEAGQANSTQIANIKQEIENNIFNSSTLRKLNTLNDSVNVINNSINSQQFTTNNNAKSSDRTNLSSDEKGYESRVTNNNISTQTFEQKNSLNHLDRYHFTENTQKITQQQTHNNLNQNSTVNSNVSNLTINSELTNINQHSLSSAEHITNRNESRVTDERTIFNSSNIVHNENNTDINNDNNTVNNSSFEQSLQTMNKIMENIHLTASNVGRGSNNTNSVNNTNLTNINNFTSAQIFNREVVDNNYISSDINNNYSFNSNSKSINPSNPVNGSANILTPIRMSEANIVFKSEVQPATDRNLTEEHNDIKTIKKTKRIENTSTETTVDTNILSNNLATKLGNDSRSIDEIVAEKIPSINKIADKVYKNIESRLRSERNKRGMN